jgi:hypothetical protein
MDKKIREDMGMAPLMIVGLMILAGLCVWCIAVMPDGFLPGAK